LAALFSLELGLVRSLAIVLMPIPLGNRHEGILFNPKEEMSESCYGRVAQIERPEEKGRGGADGNGEFVDHRKFSRCCGSVTNPRSAIWATRPHVVSYREMFLEPKGL
jgi:hypothetical protein